MFKISVIIPVKFTGDFTPAIEALKKVDYPQELIEVLVSFGFNPSEQRNKAAKKAKGEILYFLDNDSEIEKDALKRVVKTFSGQITPVKIQPQRGFSIFPDWLSDFIKERFFSGTIYKGEIEAVGGPNLWLKRESFWATITGVILESFFCHSKMAARYRPMGNIHRATEKELILCNLAIKKKIFNKVGGFNESLYPNEENELLNRVEKQGFQLIYHPEVLVFKPRRQSLKEILTTIFRYGRGRMEQIRIEGIWQSFLFLTPLFFLFYLLFLIFELARKQTLLLFYHCLIFFLPLILYLTMAFGSALGFALRRKKLYLTFFLPLLFLTTHLSYAIGLLYGLLTDLERKKRSKRGNKIKVVKIKSFKESWSSVL